MALITSRRGHIAENVYIICFILTLAMYALGRTLVGRCPEGTSTWDQQSCNPSAAIHTIPLDFYGMNLVAPLIPQLLFKGASRWAILVSWVICVGYFNASHAVAGAPLDSYAWINIHFAILIGLSYEFERGLLATFLANKEKDVYNDQRIEAIEELEMNKRSMMEAEMTKKRAMVRYIGHEIRNPLNTIQGLLEVLQLELQLEVYCPASICSNATRFEMISRPRLHDSWHVKMISKMTSCS